MPKLWFQDLSAKKEASKERIGKYHMEEITKSISSYQANGTPQYNCYCVFRSKSAGFLEQIGHPVVAVKGKCQVFVTSDSVSKAGGGAVSADRAVE